ncbi:hypothetical protein FHS81_000861 [Pseudochelatococcus contaminans]|uniref:Uncharacterized protein n=1 Tax=Pseudochelatococcus contaminans TaxID=1538103 RepID=A0A7W6EFH7_9HYPH|nr:hypothetical protein [Pseudochelatococcus contaminans]
MTEALYHAAAFIAAVGPSLALLFLAARNASR